MISQTCITVFLLKRYRKVNSSSVNISKGFRLCRKFLGIDILEISSSTSASDSDELLVFNMLLVFIVLFFLMKRVTKIFLINVYNHQITFKFEVV